MRAFVDLRLRAGLSIDEAGSFLGISPQTAEAYERGDLKPTVRELQALSGLASVVPRARKQRTEQLAIADLFPAARRSQSEQLKQDASAAVCLSLVPGARAIEDDAFPFEAISTIAERESWRKEINRPLSHIHKWWAQRLGSVFRAIVLGALAPKGADVLDLFYRRVRIADVVIYDPFMGSGTTIVETAKLGARAIGRDINQVAYFLVKNAVALHDRTSVIDTFHQVERDVAGTLGRFYQALLPDGRRVPVLYYFWTKTVPCPACDSTVRLFPSYVFAQHAYPKRFPEAQAVCPSCGRINTVRYDATAATCSTCHAAFDPSHGPARGQKAQCPCCGHHFPIAKTVRERGVPPAHHMYAKLVLMPDGSKRYLAADDFDRALYGEAEVNLGQRKAPYPVVEIAPGYNTNQAIGYNYKYWHEFFNARQLLCLSILGDRLRGIEDPALRDLFVCLFSGMLEFNNMFASYKGEGTGAVRHMFYHHILKPERMPLEANVWGTPRSSGSFSTMFESRILRAMDYSGRPFELKVMPGNGEKSTQKVYGLSEPVGCQHADNFDELDAGKPVYLSCGDSSKTDLRSGTVDVVVTDPPFFDNVHYSELADFFHVWQRHLLGNEGGVNATTTRCAGEVQHASLDAFTDRLTGVWSECHRVLKDDGLLVFTYHHSRAEGWRAILKALMDAGFGVVASHPVKAEMSVATPKHQAKEPIDLDMILVCRKLQTLDRRPGRVDLWTSLVPVAANQVRRLRLAGRSLSRGDLRIIVMGQLLRDVSLSKTTRDALTLMDAHASEIEDVIETLCVGDGLAVEGVNGRGRDLQAMRACGAGWYSDRARQPT